MVRCPTCDIELTLSEMIIHGLKNHQVTVKSIGKQQNKDGTL